MADSNLTIEQQMSLDVARRNLDRISDVGELRRLYLDLLRLHFARDTVVRQLLKGDAANMLNEAGYQR